MTRRLLTRRLDYHSSSGANGQRRAYAHLTRKTFSAVMDVHKHQRAKILEARLSRWRW